MYKTKLVHCSDLIPNLVVEIEIFNFFVCLLVLKSGLWRGTVGENREFWLLKTSMIFKVISWDLDGDLSEHITLNIQ